MSAGALHQTLLREGALRRIYNSVFGFSLFFLKNNSPTSSTCFPSLDLNSWEYIPPVSYVRGGKRNFLNFFPTSQGNCWQRYGFHSKHTMEHMGLFESLHNEISPWGSCFLSYLFRTPLILNLDNEPSVREVFPCSVLSDQFQSAANWGNHIIQWFSNLVCIRISWGFRILQTGDSETILEGESGNLHRIYIPDDADAVG